MSDSRTDTNRLHPVSILYFVVMALKESRSYIWIIPLGLLWIKKWFGHEVNQVVVFIVVAFILLGIFVLIGRKKWRNFTYQVNENSIYIKSGVLVKKERWITPDRLHSIDSTIRAYDRIFNTITLTMEVAGGEDSSVELSCIRQEEAERIRAVLSKKSVDSSGDEQTRETESVSANVEPSASSENLQQQEGTVKSIQITTRELIIHSMLSPKFSLIFFVLLGGAFKLWDKVRKDRDIDLVSLLPGWILDNWIVLSIVILLVLSAVLSFLWTLIGDYGFKLSAQDTDLIIERGLFEKKKTSIAQKRIQSVQLIQSPLQRLFGYVCVRVVFVRNRKEKDTESSMVLHPILRIAEVPVFLNGYTHYYVAENLQKVSKKSLRYYLLVPTLISIAVCVPIIVFVPKSYGWFAVLIPIYVLIYCLMEYKLTSWKLEEKQLTIQNGGFTRKVTLIKKDRVQWSQLSHTIFQQRKDIASVNLAIASGNNKMKVSLPYIPQPEAELILKWTQRRHNLI
ncbi:PH domain-containing protein [Paenibacillus radicibacter]|uniref:PH domain-containing protein n=1 Tax=Paenibacillus radicibacter TaxID=2972488 RepID=UPI0021595E01|nr:PH domain-containing protein [Paenibacillus radicibacter]